MMNVLSIKGNKLRIHAATWKNLRNKPRRMDNSTRIKFKNKKD